ncbi:4-hydroxybenzoate 3-monooxygenase (NAD(P)H) [Streptomyces sp. enrichment culture]
MVAPIAAKCLNLALHDAFALGDALVARLLKGDGSGLDGYSEGCLRRVWDYQEFSQWLAELYHGGAAGDPFRAGTALARLRRLFSSKAAAAAFAERYLGTAARY